MTLPADTPKLPKWIFLTSDAVLLTAAWFVATHAAHPTSGGALVAIVACAAIGSVLGAIPYITDYARRQDEALDDRQRSLDALARTVTSSAEQISIAASGLQHITELAQGNLRQAEELSLALRGRIADYQAQLAGKNDGEKERAARIESAAEKISRAAADTSKLEATARKSLTTALAEFESKIATLGETIAQRTADSLSSRIEACVGTLDEKIAASVQAAENAASHVGQARGGAGKTELVSISIPAAHSPDIGPDEGAKPEKRRRKAVAGSGEQPVLGIGIESVVPVGEAGSLRPQAEPALAAASPEAATAVAEPEAAESAVSSDGATRLLVTAYIGIGNRLFIRGEGPGLSWEKGAPLQFVSIGKWRWEAAGCTSPVRFKLYKNDEAECSSLGEQSVEPGRQQELAANF